jgi:excisionase family DNA binding protein
MHAQATALPVGQDTSEHGLAGETGRIAYTVAEVAKLLGKHSNTVYGWVRVGALPSERIGNTIYIPKWALARLEGAPAGGASSVRQPAPVGGEAA